MGCNKKQYPYLKRLKELNYKIILIDKNRKSVGRKISHQYFSSSYLDIKKLNLIYKKIKTQNIVNIFTASSQFSYVGATYLAQKLKLSYPSFKNINICLSKNLFYNFFKKHDLKVPKCFKIKNKKELKKNLKNKKHYQFFYLKSDYGKSPFYLYKGNPKTLLETNINWKKNQFFRKNYILQKRFVGRDLRINIFKNKFEIYDFNSGKMLKINNFPILKKNNIIKKLHNVSNDLGMKNWILKFDIILDKHDYQVLDIGIDPPARMIKHWKRLNKNFVSFYLNLYLKK